MPAARISPASISPAWILFLLAFSFACTSANAQTTTPSAGQTTEVMQPVKSMSSMENHVFLHGLLDQFEGRTNSHGTAFRWDGEAWTGTDMNRLWIKSEGTVDKGTMSDGDHEALYDRPIPHMRYFDAQAGVRADLDSGPTRVWAALGIEGLSPYAFELAPTLYISDGGHIGGRIEGSKDLLITQRLIIQPEAELNFYSKNDSGRKLGSGLSDIDTGIRVRYEINRKFAPYVGFVYSGDYDGSATYARQSGEPTNSPTFVFGLRVWR
jgi:copper resistance protein B